MAPVSETKGELLQGAAANVLGCAGSALEVCIVTRARNELLAEMARGADLRAVQLDLGFASERALRAQASSLASALHHASCHLAAASYIFLPGSP